MNKSWLKFSFKFIRYSIRQFQRALVEFNNLSTHVYSREFNWVHTSKWRVELLFFQFPFWKIWFDLKNLRRFDLEFFFVFYFSSQRELHSVSNIDSFVKLWLVLIQGQNYQNVPQDFNGKLWQHHLFCFINCLFIWPRL